MTKFYSYNPFKCNNIYTPNIYFFFIFLNNIIINFYVYFKDLKERKRLSDKFITKYQKEIKIFLPDLSKYESSNFKYF
jgi:hypothetical protein